MSRLADYFVIVGLSEREKESKFAEFFFDNFTLNDSLQEMELWLERFCKDSPKEIGQAHLS